MNVEEIAKNFVEVYRSEEPNRKYELYSNNCVSVERPAGQPAVKVRGLSAIQEQSDIFYSQFDTVHSRSVSEPLISDTAFCLVISLDVTKVGGERAILSELCIFHVVDGKIISSEFIFQQ